MTTTHPIQDEILNLSKTTDINGMSLRDIGKLINIPNSPQQIKHHIGQLIKKGLLQYSKYTLSTNREAQNEQ